MTLSRRVFLAHSALAMLGVAAPHLPAGRRLCPADTRARAKRLVVIFQRGGADGLNIVAPHGEPLYYTMRPTIHIPRKSLLDLDGFFGLHPAMTPLYPLWQQKRLAIVHAAGSPDPTRSHADAQDFMESGTPGVKRSDGWLNRTLLGNPSLCTVGMGPVLPRMLSGRAPDVAEHVIALTQNCEDGHCQEPGARG